MPPFRAHTPPVEALAADGMRTASAAMAWGTRQPDTPAAGSLSPGTSSRQLPDTAEAAVVSRMRSSLGAIPCGAIPQRFPNSKSGSSRAASAASWRSEGEICNCELVKVR